MFHVRQSMVFIFFAKMYGPKLSLKYQQLPGSCSAQRMIQIFLFLLTSRSLFCLSCELSKDLPNRMVQNLVADIQGSQTVYLNGCGDPCHHEVDFCDF